MNDKRKLIHSLVFPLFFILIIWCVKVFEIASGISLAFLGVYPMKFYGLVGIVTSPLIHGDFNHLINNSVPLLIFSVATFYFYRPLGYKIFFLTWLMTGIWVWCGAREAYHIGASGIVYGLAFFLVFSGIFRRIPELAAISLIVVFLYGGMIWGLFPFIPDISWESHLSGGVAGLILAFLYRHEGPQPKKFDWENEEDPYEVGDADKQLFEISEGKAKEEDNSPETQETTKPEGKIIYLYKRKDKDDDEK
jgi:membrane associated rhomboid family serine protease